jgi:hypothetical protein
MSENACIICMDDGIEPLLENKSCKCKYKTHATCWERYRQTTNPLKCPTCRRIITSSIQIAPSAPPVSPSSIIEYTILPEIVISTPRNVTPSNQRQVQPYQQSYQTNIIINNATPLIIHQIPEQSQPQIVIQQRRLWNDLTPEEKKKRLIISGIIGIITIIILIIVLYYIV